MFFMYFDEIINFWLSWVFVARHRLSLIMLREGYSLVEGRRLLTAVASVVADLELVSSAVWLTGSVAPCGMWNLPGPGIEPMSPVLAGRFLTTGTPEKFLRIVFIFSNDQKKFLKEHYFVTHDNSIQSSVSVKYSFIGMQSCLFIIMVDAFT